jgi:hypothetical protein
MSLSRRSFFATTPGAALAGRVIGASAQPPLPWYRSMRRCGQINFNERDPETLDIGAWLDYWSSLKLDALLLNAGGIVAFYPTRIPYHRRSRFLGARDLFGDFAKAARQRGMRVIARLDCNLAYEDAFQAHPEWFERTAGGEPVRHGESTWLLRTCMFSSYFSEQIPAIISEINSLYDVDGFFTNGWPGTGRPPACFCEACRRLAPRPTPEFYRQHEARVLEIWKLWDSTARRKKWDSVYVGNLGGGIRAVTNVKKIGEIAGWFNADHQGRTGNTPIWDCAQQGRVAQAVMKGGTITNVTGSYANTRPLWRHTSKSPAEATMWLAQTTASGMVPWYHWLGGSPEDLRWRQTGRAFFEWIAREERHFVNRRSVANIGVVFGQRTNAFYRPPGGGDVTEFLQGLYYALLEGRFFFDFVHEDDLDPATLRKYRALLLPNLALLSDEQCRRIAAYAQGGGSLLATFETGRYGEWGERRPRLGLGDVFRVEAAGEIEGPKGNAYYARIEGQHPVLRGFENTRLLPGAEYRLPVRSGSRQPLSVVPPYPAFPPEMVYPSVPRTGEPAIVVSEQGPSRRVWLPGDVDRACWRSGNTDLSLLLQNCVRWLVAGEQPVSVEGDGLVELFAWHTEPGAAVHILNYTNPNMAKGWFRQAYPIGPQRVRMELPGGAGVRGVRALRAGSDLHFTQQGCTVEFTVPAVTDYEVAAIALH